MDLRGRGRMDERVRNSRIDIKKKKKRVIKLADNK